MLDKEVDRKHFIQTQQETIERLGKLGIILDWVMTTNNS